MKGCHAIASRLMQAATAAAVLLAAGVAEAQTPPWVRIRNISYAGTGCPAGSVAENLASDYRAFTLLFDTFVAQTGANVPFAEKRKNCQVNLDLDFPNGWSFTVFTVDYRGYAALDRGVTGTQKSTYYFQGQRTGPSLATNLYGPTDRDYQIRDTLGLEAVVWSPCGEKRSLNINSQVRLEARDPNANGVMTIDSIDGELKQTYGIQWRQCR